MDVAAAPSTTAPLLASVPGGGAAQRLHFAACVGNRLLVLPLGGEGGDGAPAVTRVQW